MSNFLEEISSLSHSIAFIYFFVLITKEGFLISPCYSLELSVQMGISFLFSFASLFSSFGEGNGNPLQYSYLENPMDGGTWLGYSP